VLFNSLFVFGGANVPLSAALLRINLAALEVDILSAPPTMPRAHAALLVDGSQLLMFGGVASDAVSAVPDDAWLIDATGVWQALTVSSTSSYPRGDVRCAAHLVDAHAIVAVPSDERLYVRDDADADVDMWRIAATQLSTPQLQGAVCGARSGVAMLVVGGGGGAWQWSASCADTGCGTGTCALGDCMCASTAAAPTYQASACGRVARTPTPTPDEVLPIALSAAIATCVLLVLVGLFAIAWRRVITPHDATQARAGASGGGNSGSSSVRASSVSMRAYIEPLNPMSGVRSSDPARAGTIEFDDARLKSTLVKGGAFPEYPLVLSKHSLDFGVPAGVEADVDVELDDSVQLTSDRDVAFRFALVASAKFRVAFEPSSGVVRAGADGVDVRVVLTPLCTTTIEIAVALHCVLGSAIADLDADVDHDASPAALEAGSSKAARAAKKSASARGVRVRHAYIDVRVASALSTKLDYDELGALVSVGKDGTYGTVFSGACQTATCDV
jgi:hypothetical protein